MKFLINEIRKISNFENRPLFQNCCNCSILKIYEFSKLNTGKLKKNYFNISKINILQYQKKLNILGVRVISKK